MKIFDAHFHIIDSNFPLVRNNGYLPPEFTVDDYKAKTKSIKIEGGCVVSGSFQAFDQSYLINALDKLGNNFYGVANIPVQCNEEELQKLNNAGIVAVRFNLKRGGSESVNNLVSLSNKVFEDYGWHTELYLDSKNLPNLKSKLDKIQEFSVDHIGLSREGLNDLYYWVEKGVKVKATGFGRVNFDPLPVLKKIYKINPHALMFGTDLPSTRAQIPFSMNDLKLIKMNFSESAQRKILYENAYKWYNKSH